MVLDTGPLLTYLAMQYLEWTGADKAFSDAVVREVSRAEITDENQQISFRDFLKAHSRRVTTSHVIAEALYPRASSELGKDKETFRRVALDNLAFIQERPVLLKDLDRELIVRHGVCDAGVVRLAQLEEAALLTNDERLCGALPGDPNFTILLTRHLHW